MNKTSVCCIYNSAPHYRRGIFLKMDDEFDCKFVFGKYPIGSKDIKQIPQNHLKNCKIINNCVFIKAPFYWQNNVLIELFNGYKDYLILGEPYCISTWIFLLITRFIPSKRVFLWTHGWYGREGKLKTIVKKTFFKLCDGIFTYGNYAKNLMMKEGIPSNKISVIHNSLDYKSQLPIRNNLIESDIYKKHFKNNNPVLIFIGRLTESKKLDMALKAMSILKEQFIPLNFVIIGNGGIKDVLSDLTKKLGLQENVWFYGACYNELENANLIYNADICISPGNIGLTAIHSMMFGCPCITHSDFPYQGPEFEAISEGITGSFFENNNIESLANSIKQWIKNSKDRQIIRNNCYNQIDLYWTPDFQIKALKERLQKR